MRLSSCGGRPVNKHTFGNSRFKASIGYTVGVCQFQCCSQDRLYGAILIETGDGYETYEWALSSSLNREISVTATNTATENVVSEMKQARQGSRDLLLEEDEHNQKKLLVRNFGLDNGMDCCTCKAAAVFDCIVRCKSAWSETAAQPDNREITSPKVAVGFSDGTVHFMELRNRGRLTCINLQQRTCWVVQ
jgi:hypothetical protein